ncbi:MAG: pyridoxamine 5'-phosphate oxidase family protein [Rhodospirillaceae bacterium]|nr:pyridoxamine 5'-phosphate oxidase family protein [Rhodospirillaceae bacterium]
MADTLEDGMIKAEFGAREARFVETADMFFLSTIDRRGFPTVSYKGGAPGFVKVLDPRTLAFPIYDGNGMFYSAGNLSDNGKVGLLFIDFQTPRRMRLHGTAAIDGDDPLLGDYKEAQVIVRVALEDVFLNCARYIHKFSREGTSDFAPREGHDTPVALWKNLDFVEEKLSKTDTLGPSPEAEKITYETYREEFWRDLD